MASLAELKASILKDGIIDEGEVAEIRKVIYEDGTVDREEANFLFELNDATSGKANDASWTALFVAGISDHVLKDEKSPGVIDKDEAAYLKQQIEGDGKVDANEISLLRNLRAKAAGDIPEDLTTLFTANL